MGAILFAFTIGCDSTFEPFNQQDEYQFSIYGHLDVSADTNWVRVMPVRETLYLSSDSIDALVTLENLETGEISQMEGELFNYGDETHAWNFWTTMELDFDKQYRLTSTKSNGLYSTVDITTPSEFSPPVFYPSGSDYVIHLSDVEQLVDLILIYDVYNRTLDQEYRYELSYTGEWDYYDWHGYRAEIDTSEDFALLQQALGEQIQILNTEVKVVAATEEWPDFMNADEEELLMPENFSNVQNGLGFVNGVVSKIFPVP